MTNQSHALNLTDYIISLTQKPNAKENMALLIESLFANQPQKDTLNEPENSKSRSVSSIIKFTQQEIKYMSTTFKKVFIANGLAAHVIKKPSGKSSFKYEIRYRANGYSIIACSTDLRKAKEKFLEKNYA